MNSLDTLFAGNLMKLIFKLRIFMIQTRGWQTMACEPKLACFYKVLQKLLVLKAHTTPIHLQSSTAAVIPQGRTESLEQRPQGLESTKYLLFGPLQKRFANTRFKPF